MGASFSSLNKDVKIGVIVLAVALAICALVAICAIAMRLRYTKKKRAAGLPPAYSSVEHGINDPGIELNTSPAPVYKPNGPAAETTTTEPAR